MISRRVLVTCGVLVACLAALSAGVYLARSRDVAARVTVVSGSGDQLWTRSLRDGYAVVIAASSRAALVAQADDCVQKGAGEVDLVTPEKVTLVSATTACRVMEWSTASGGATVVRSAARLSVTVPAELGGSGTVSLACPCGVHTRVENGTFVPGGN